MRLLAPVRFLLVLLPLMLPMFAASGQTPAPVELRLQEVLERWDRQAESILLEAQDAFILMSAPVGDGAPLADLAESLFGRLPQGVSRLWLSWPGEQASEARLFWRGGPVRSQVRAMLRQVGATNRTRIVFRADRCDRLWLDGVAHKAQACEAGLRFTAPIPCD